VPGLLRCTGQPPWGSCTRSRPVNGAFRFQDSQFEKNRNASVQRASHRVLLRLGNNPRLHAWVSVTAISICTTSKVTSPNASNCFRYFVRPPPRAVGVAHACGVHQLAMRSPHGLAPPVAGDRQTGLNALGQRTLLLGSCLTFILR